MRTKRARREISWENYIEYNIDNLQVDVYLISLLSTSI